MRYLFSGKASVKHLTTTDDTGSPRLLKEHKQEKKRPGHIKKNKQTLKY